MKSRSSFRMAPVGNTRLLTTAIFPNLDQVKKKWVFQSPDFSGRVIKIQKCGTDPKDLSHLGVFHTMTNRHPSFWSLDWRTTTVDVTGLKRRLPRLHDVFVDIEQIFLPILISQIRQFIEIGELYIRKIQRRGPISH